MSGVSDKLAYWAITFIIAGSFGWTTLVRSESREADTQQQQQLDTLLELQKATLARECILLPTEEQRSACLDKVYPPTPTDTTPAEEPQ